MAAQALAPALRRLKPKAMRRHAKQLVAALAAGSVAAGVEEGPGGARLRSDTLDGCSQLLFFAAKGVHGRTHSQVRVGCCRVHRLMRAGYVCTWVLGAGVRGEGEDVGGWR